jgi:biopolymer transport protein ExbD
MHNVDIAASVTIHADEMTDFKTLKFVMDSCLTAGLTKIVVNPSTIVIGIDRDGVISVNHGNVTEAQLGPLLTQMHIASPAISVLIKCDEINQMKTLAFVMESCRNAGMNKFSLQSR